MSRFEKTDLAIISFRDHHHAHSKSDDVEIEENLPTSSFFATFMRYFYTFVLVHYFWWVGILAGFILYLWRLGIIGFLISVGLIIAYLPSFLDGSHVKLGRPWDEFRRSKLWYYAQQYGQMEAVRTCPLNDKKQYIFGIYPHGILILSRVATYGNVIDRLFPNISWRVLGATPMFWIPGAREICLWMGAVDAGAPTAKKILQKGFSLLIYPGGTKEIFTTDPDSKETKLVMRKGFVKLALQHGCDLVPTFVFGEKWVYRRLHPYPAIKTFFYNVLKVPLIIFWGKWLTWLPITDPTRPMSIVFGTPIPVPKIENPTDEEINTYHKKFIQGIETIFEKYKIKFGYTEDETLGYIQP